MIQAREPNLFRLKHGIIVACDVTTDEELSNLVRDTCDTDGVVAYKIGASLALKYGLGHIGRCISEECSKVMIYDHQKFGTDIPDLGGGPVLEVIKEAGFEALILFPLAGPETLEWSIRGDPNHTNPAASGCIKVGLVPIVGSMMTHKRFIASEGGYIRDDAPQNIFETSARLGVRYFVLPATKPSVALQLFLTAKKEVPNPIFMFPGVGKSFQGGDLSALQITEDEPSYAIIGREIYLAQDVKSAVTHLAELVSSMP
jgi:orotidine-5'-phosphate decarboxylase